MRYSFLFRRAGPRTREVSLAYFALERIAEEDPHVELLCFYDLFSPPGGESGFLLVTDGPCVRDWYIEQARELFFPVAMLSE